MAFEQLRALIPPSFEPLKQLGQPSQALPGNLRMFDQGQYSTPAPTPTPAMETPKLQNGQLLPYKPTTLQRIKDALRKLNQKAGETAEFVGQAGAGPLTDIASAAFRPRGNDLKGLSPYEQERIQKEWAPESFRRSPETAKYISPTTAEIASTAGSVYPYLIAGPAAALLGAAPVEAAVGKYLPKVASTVVGKALGKYLPKVASTLPKMAEQGATFGGLAAIEEAVRGMSEPEKFDLAQSVKRILSSTGEGALFGAGQEFIGAPLKNVAARIPALSKPGVVGTAGRTLAGAATDIAGGSPVIGLHLAEGATPQDAAKEVAFFGTMGAVTGALGGPASYAERIRRINEQRGYAPKVAEATKQAEAEIAARRAELEKPAETPAEAPQAVPEAAPVAEPSSVTAEAPRAVSETPKEPWQITRAEYEGTAAEPPTNFSGSKHPEVVYHGSGADNIEQFFTTGQDLAGNTGAKTARLGAFFSEDPTIARIAAYGFSPLGAFDAKRKLTLYEARVNLRNPLEVNNLTKTQIAELEQRMPGFETAYEKAKKKGEMFGVVQFLSRYREPAPSVGNFSEWAAQHGIPEADVERLWRENAPAFQEWQKASDAAYASTTETAAPRVLQEMGYDGIVVNTKMDSGENLGAKKQYIVFRPEDIAISRRYPVVEHKQLVEQALAEGKPIPADVLKDYPDLAAQTTTTTPAETPAQATAPAEAPAAVAETVTAAAPVETTATTEAGKSDRVQAVVLPYLQEFIEQDVVPKSKGFVQELRTVLTDLVHWLSPRTGVSDEGLTLLMRMKGERDKALFIMERTGRAIRRQFERMPKEEQVAFIDRIKKGEAQPTPELQAIADSYRKMDDATFEEIKKFRPSLPFLENHFRVLWKVIPGRAEEKGFLGLFRRPLQGSKGFLKHATLADMSEGIAKGGVPVSYNPQTMFELAQADAQRFITAQKMWVGMKEKGFAKFVRMGDSIPEGYVRLNDAIAKVYFPTEEGLVGTGEYYVEANTGRLLNNFLSRDLIRETALGRGLMWMKNWRTAAELSLSPFHLVFETIEAIGSQQGVGFLKLYNQGILKRDPQAFLAGLKDIVTSPVAWKGLASTGGSVLRYVDSKEEFLKTLRGQKFLKEFPDAEQLLDDLFTGGGKLAMHEDYRLNTVKTLFENINSQNYIGASIRLVPALNEVLMTPLFEQYIPRLKIGLFFKEYSQQLAENADLIARGKVSRGALARQTWDRVENRFGEMNFDNLFWNRTLKTGLQFMFRSVTWKLGNVRGFSSALANQARNFADPLTFARDEAGRIRYKGKAPKLDPGAAWVLGMMMTTATLATIIQYAYTGTWPQELKDYVYPKIGGTDDKGNDNRVSLPTYFRDAYHLWKNPGGYIKSSMSGFVTNFLEAAGNKDYYGNYIYDPENPAYKKLLTAVAHVVGDSSYIYDPEDPTYKKVAGVVGWGVPMPFSFEQSKRLREQGASPAQKLLGMAGFTKAPSDIIQTPFQQELLKAYLKQRGPRKPLTPAEQKLDQVKRDLRRKAKDGTITSEDLQRAIDLGLIKPKGVKAFMRDAGYNSMQIMWRYLSRDERDKLLPLANAEELGQLKVVR